MNYNYSEIYPIKTELHKQVVTFILDKFPSLVDIHIKSGDDYSFTLRNGYWDEIGDGVLESVKEEFNCKINCFIDEDEDTGENFIYTVVKNNVNNT